MRKVDAPTLVVDALAVARLTTLFTTDRVTRGWRRALIGNLYGHAGRPIPEYWDELGSKAVLEDPDAPMPAYLASCAWCMSPYIAVIVLAARTFIPGMWGPVAKVLAASEVAGLAASHV